MAEVEEAIEEGSLVQAFACWMAVSLQQVDKFLFVYWLVSVRNSSFTQSPTSAFELKTSKP